MGSSDERFSLRPKTKKRSSEADRPVTPEAKRLKATTDKDIESSTEQKAIAETPGQPSNKKSAPATTLPTHIRFSSTSPPPASAIPDVLAPIEKPTEADESDDDAAPEAVSLKTAQKQVLATEAVTARAVQQQNSAKRQRRRNRDKLLREQAATSGRKKDKVENSREKGGGTEAENSSADVGNAEQEPYSLDNLPALLPDELLATEPPIRPPTPPPTTESQQQISRKSVAPSSGYAPINILKQKAPKDLKINGLNIRILAQTNPLLPPKVAKSSKSVRETWLKGRAECAKNNKKSKKVVKGESKWQRRSVGRTGIF